MKLLNLKGRVFGRLTVLTFVRMHGHLSVWRCRCECGVVKDVSRHNLINGSTVSCGCFRRENCWAPGTYPHVHGNAAYRHGHASARTPEYRSWMKMRSRCHNPQNRMFAHYGGRGIRVCSRWDKFENFLKDMGPRQPKMTLDRKNVHGHYCKRNCRWATAREQAATRTDNRAIKFRNEILNLSEWSRRLKVPRSTLFNRLAGGWSVQRAFTAQ